MYHYWFTKRDSVTSLAGVYYWMYTRLSILGQFSWWSLLCSLFVEAPGTCDHTLRKLWAWMFKPTARAMLWLNFFHFISCNWSTRASDKTRHISYCACFTYVKVHDSQLYLSITTYLLVKMHINIFMSANHYCGDVGMQEENCIWLA